MNIIVMSKGNVERMHTMRMLDAINVPYSVVVHTREQARVVRDNANPVQVHVTKCATLVENRNYVLRRLVKRGEWFISADDNIQRFDMVHPRFYRLDRLDTAGMDAPMGFKSWRHVYRTPSDRGLVNACSDLVDCCAQQGTIYGGFASMENPFFRMRKWSNVRFVKSKLCVLCNVRGLEWKGSDYAHDSWLSAYVVANYGKVLVNNFAHPVHRMYEQGGLGKVQERMPHLEPALASIIEEFPGLVARGRGAHTALRFTRTSVAAVANWRRQHGYL